MPRYPIVGADAIRIIANEPVVQDIGLRYLEYGQRNMQYVSYPRGEAALFIPTHNTIPFARAMVNVFDKMRKRTNDSLYKAQVSMVQMPAFGLVPFEPSIITAITHAGPGATDELNTKLSYHARHLPKVDLFTHPDFRWYRVIDTQADLARRLSEYDMPYVSVPLANNRLTYAFGTHVLASNLRACGFESVQTFDIFQFNYRSIQGLAVPFAPLIEFSDDKNIRKAV